MKKLLLLFAFVVISHSIVFSQGCLPEGIFFETQEQINNFQTNYPGCTEIEGDVYIYGPEINNLSSLAEISSIGGMLIIDTTFLTNLAGLNNLISISSNFWIKSNIVLNNLTDLENLSSIAGNFAIGNYFDGNQNLLNLDGLEGLTTITGSLYVHSNDVLENLAGLQNITYIGGDLSIGHNYALSNLSGLENLDTIGNRLDIAYMNLTSLSGLENLDFIGNDGLYIQSITGLSNLTGLESLNSVGGVIYLSQNYDLLSLTGLENIEPNSISSLTITFNSHLSNCDLQNICDFLESPNANIYIENNAPGCDTPVELEAACLTSVEEKISNDEITLFPNPATSFITIQIQEGIPVEQVIIYNHLGQKVLETKPVNNTLDVSKLMPGIYFIEVATKDWRGRTKLVKL